MQIQGFTLAERDRHLHRHTRVVHDNAAPSRLRENRVQAVIGFPVARVLQTEGDQARFSRVEVVRKQGGVAAQLDAVLFCDPHRDAQHSLHVAVPVVVEGDVPVLRLHVGAGRDGEVEPHGGGHASIEVLEDDVVVVVVGVEVCIDANLEVRAHPRRVADVREHANGSGLVPVVRDVTLEHQHAIWR